jgi:NAD+ kinase
MKKISIVYNPDKKSAKKVINEIRGWCNKRGLTAHVYTAAEKIGDCDLCIVAGGDGTILQTARQICPYNIPILGINIGRLGFLAEFDYNKSVFKLLDKIVTGTYSIQERVMLDVKINNKHYIAVNDCILHSNQSTRTIQLTVKINNDTVTEYIADGIIIATPTGSTAYSLAANGPIVYPTLPVLMITPVCSHTLSQRPIIVTDSSMITVEFSKYKLGQKGLVSVDSQELFPFTNTDKIVITKSMYKFKLITHPDRNYYDILRNKLGWGK